MVPERSGALSKLTTVASDLELSTGETEHRALADAVRLAQVLQRLRDPSDRSQPADALLALIGSAAMSRPIEVMRASAGRASSNRLPTSYAPAARPDLVMDKVSESPPAHESDKCPPPFHRDRSWPIHRILPRMLVHRSTEPNTSSKP